MNKQKADLIIRNTSEVVTCAAEGDSKKGSAMSDAGRIEKGAVVVKEGVITAVGPESEIEAAYTSERFFDAGGSSVVPGFVESHTHLVYAGNRIDEFELRIQGADYLEILQSGGGIHSTVEKTRKASSEELLAQARVRLDRLFAGGVTTCEIKTGYGLETQAELKMLNVILRLGDEHVVDVVPTFLAAHAVPPEWKGKEDKFTDLICREMIPEAARLLRSSEFRVQSSDPSQVWLPDLYQREGG